MPKYRNHGSVEKSVSYSLENWHGNQELLPPDGETELITRRFYDLTAYPGLALVTEEPVYRVGAAEFTVTNAAGAGGVVSQAIGYGVAKARVLVVSGGPVNVYKQDETANDGVPEIAWMVDGAIWTVDVFGQCTDLVFEFEGGNGSVRMVTYNE